MLCSKAMTEHYSGDKTWRGLILHQTNNHILFHPLVYRTISYNEEKLKRSELFNISFLFHFVSQNNFRIKPFPAANLLCTSFFCLFLRQKDKLLWDPQPFSFQTLQSCLIFLYLGHPFYPWLWMTVLFPVQPFFEGFICHLWIILFMKHNHQNQNEKKKNE